MSDLRNILNGIENLVSGLKDDLMTMGKEEIEVAGPQEEVEGYTEGDPETGAGRRKIRYMTRKSRRKQAKEIIPGMESFSRRLQSVETGMKDLGKAIKSRGIAKVAGSGNRGFFSATAANTAAGATVTTANIVGNADQAYDRVGFVANTPSLISAVTGAGNPILDGSASIPVDAGQVVGPVELSEPIKLNGNAGVVFTTANRGAAAGDSSVLFIPVGHSFGDANPGSF